jgi:hypothetical protein
MPFRKPRGHSPERSPFFTAIFETLEGRRLLSGVLPADPVLRPVSPIGYIPGQGGFATLAQTGGLSVAQVRGAYGLGQYGASTITFNGVQGDGAGQTIALVDAYNDPDIGTDLQTFDAAEGLPNPPAFTVVGQTGSTTSLPQNSPGNDDWSVEESLDVEWAHAIAPGASILVVECTSDQGNYLFQGDQIAAAYPGVSVVSNSWGGGESGSETSYDNTYFVTPSGHTGVTFFASAGDTGAEVAYPAASPNIVAVGGTQLTVSGNSWSSETAWSDGGGGTSSYESQPGFQAGTITSSKREVPDISIAGGPNTLGDNSYVPVADSYVNGSSAPWEGVDGTSWSSPMVTALVAIADQGRAAEGLPLLITNSTQNQTDTRLYELSTANYHDITTGSNGHSAVAGYDEATGIGTPIASLLVPDLAGAATITGRVFADVNGTGVYQAGDPVFASQTVYLDLNNDGKRDNSEPFAVTNAQGIYTFTDEPAGGTVRLYSPTIAGYAAVPVTSAAIVYGATDTVNFTFFPLSFSNTASSTNYTLQTDSTNTNDQIYVNGTLTYSVAKSVLTGDALTFSLTGTGDSFTVNAANGNPLTSGGISITGPTGGLPLVIDGTANGVDTFNVSSNSVTFDSDSITVSKISLLTLNPGAGTDSLTVNSGSATIAPQTPGGGILTRNFSNVTIASGSSVLFSTAPLHTNRMLVETTTLSVSGQLDLGGNDMIVHGGNPSAITALLATGYNGGQWNGPGIASAAAASDTTYLTALGVMQNTLYVGGSLPRFDGAATLTTDVLIKYTWYGDTNLDGKVDGSDYSRIDNTTLFGGTGWYNGDFNYDGLVNGSDYTLIDNAFNMQSATPLAQPAAMVAAPSSTHAKSSGHVSTAVLPAVVQTVVQATATPTGSTGTDVEQLLLKKDLLDGLSPPS